MTTKITFKYHKPEVNKNNIEPYEIPFYCKESAFVVLQKVFEQYHVIKYKNITLLTEDHIVLPTIKPAIRGTYIDGVNIEEISDISATNSVSEFNKFSPNISHKRITNYDSIINELIEKYFINTKITNHGFILPGSLPRQVEVFPSISSEGTQEVENYFDIRNDKKNLIKEQELENIIEYGTVAIDKSFNIHNVEAIANKIAQSIPKTFDPQFGPYSIRHITRI